MNALLPMPAELVAQEREQFVVSHGKSGVIGAFTLTEPLSIERGQTVVVQTTRGIEIGTALRPATLRQARIFGASSSGALLRCINPQDEVRRAALVQLEQQIFELSRAWALRAALAIEVLDVDFLFDGQKAIVQFVGKDTDTEKLAEMLELHFKLTIRLENLALPAEPETHEHGGCDKPDCGREAGGCTSCRTGGGCSSCGGAKVDLREYFGHLRQNLEKTQRIPLA